jgi:hypothetical protein
VLESPKHNILFLIIFSPIHPDSAFTSEFQIPVKALYNSSSRSEIWHSQRRIPKKTRITHTAKNDAGTDQMILNCTGIIY